MSSFMPSLAQAFPKHTFYGTYTSRTVQTRLPLWPLSAAPEA